MNRGDTIDILLNITIDDVPITQDYPDDIEMTFNYDYTNDCIQKTLSSGGIVWDSSQGKFKLRLSQEDTFKLPGLCKWQIRVLKNNSVVSNTVQDNFNLGDVLSRKILIE